MTADLALKVGRALLIIEGEVGDGPRGGGVRAVMGPMTATAVPVGSAAAVERHMHYASSETLWRLAEVGPAWFANLCRAELASRKRDAREAQRRAVAARETLMRESAARLLQAVAR